MISQLSASSTSIRRDTQRIRKSHDLGPLVHRTRESQSFILALIGRGCVTVHHNMKEERKSGDETKEKSFPAQNRQQVELPH